MSSSREIKLAELKRVQKLLHGVNYEVFFHLYGPGDPDASLDETLAALLSEKSKVAGVYPSSPQKAISRIMKMVLHQGGIGYGPLQLDTNEKEIIERMTRVFDRIGLKSADVVSEFAFKEGNPTSPVFWDFAYDIHSNRQRWILVGASCD